MFRVSRRVPASKLLPSAARIGVLGLAVLGAGCASKHASTYPADRLAGPVPSPQAMASAPKIEMEADGYPVQMAPAHRRNGPDDPTEPWSPNYGTVPASKAATLPAPAASPVAAAQTAPRSAPTRATSARATITRLSSLDEDEIIRRAIAEHEMRRN